ncbi:DNA polymerase III subunit alpha [Metabacillus malikii]|uniref:DNA polymerase III subunit alpha n=1 Tax=Metabacillus malikii TaxID=1504265 RepID=A0ABT9ZFG8_9BACI|nr:DNA polymerase III subunit alpha [Metabacillus malikii]MDQ0231026.1 DNA polymerase-3 subunit alpha [Metabacillus malikii]
MPFVHLQVKSAYSLLSSAAKLEKLVKKAKQMNYQSLALTDENVMYGTVEFYKLCKQHDIKPIIGLKVEVIADEANETSVVTPLVLLAETNEGYQNLVKISSAIQTKSPQGLPERWLKSYSRGLIAFTSGQTGELEQCVADGRVDEAKLLIKKYESIFGQNSFFLGIHSNWVSEGNSLSTGFVNLGQQLDVPIVAVHHVSYIEKEDLLAYKSLLAIKNGEKFSDDHIDLHSNKEDYLTTPHEMVKTFEQLPDALENTLKIADRCQVDLNLGLTQLPKYPTPNNEPADEYLEQLCIKGLREQFETPNQVYIDRLLYELDVIKRMNFSDYFLIVWDFMKYAHEHNILTGPGRGSAAGSLVAYVLNITGVDPIKHRLLFERFLNPERISMPDIDIDFPDTRRDEMIQYVAEKYGKLHVAQIITFGTLAAKGAIRDVGRVLGASPKETDILSKQIPSKPGTTLQAAINQSQTLQKLINENELYKKIIEIAIKIEGLPRHTSTHAAGVVLSSQPLTNIVPIQNGQQDVYLTQFSMDYLEDLGLLKMDFLGLRNLSLLDNIKKLVEREEGRKIDLAGIPYENKKTFELLAKGDTTGIFQLESEGMRSVLKRLKPTTLEDIVAVNALYRPGPMENIPSFIERKHKRSVIAYLHPDLKPILETTFGVIVYQEQIMEIASKIAGFTLGEADLLRRAVGKKKKDILDKERQHFVKGCIANGYDEQISNDIYDLIVKFANYGFNRSHAVAYSMIAYQLAYLKANYPLYFMAALLTSVIGNDEKIASYIREAKQMGLVLLPPSINDSAFPFLIEKGCIRYSLAAIKNVGVVAIKEIFHGRKVKRYTDLFDFCIRVSMKVVNRRIMEQLVFSGAFDEFAVDRAILLASLDVAIEHAELLTPDSENQFDLFIDDEYSIKPKYIEVEPFKIEEKLKYEKEALGFYFSSHPVELYRDTFQYNGAVLADQLTQYHDKKVLIGAMVVQKRTIRTKKGDAMAFLILGDETGDVDAVLFPQVYAKASESIEIGSILLFSGKVEKRQGKIQLIVQSIRRGEELENKAKKQEIFLKIEDSLQSAHFVQMKDLLKRYKGETPVYLYYDTEKKTVLLPSEFFITPTAECIKSLCKLLGDRNVVLRETADKNR